MHLHKLMLTSILKYTMKNSAVNVLKMAKITNDKRKVRLGMPKSKLSLV